MSWLLSQDALVTVMALAAASAIGYRLWRATRPSSQCGACASCEPSAQSRKTTGAPSAGPATLVPLDTLRARSSQQS